MFLFPRLEKSLVSFLEIVDLLFQRCDFDCSDEEGVWECYSVLIVFCSLVVIWSSGQGVCLVLFAG